MKKSASPLIKLLNDIPEINYEYAIEAIGGSLPLFERTFKQAVRLIPAHVEKMEKHLRQDADLNAFAIEVHGIKGSLRQIGHISLSQTAEDFENSAKSGNEAHCIQHFDAFKNELLNFYNVVNTALHYDDTAKNNKSDTATHKISDFYDKLQLAQSAADNYDSMTAAELIAPLMQYQFGAEIDDLLSKAQTALEMFQAQKAMDNLTELLKHCEKPL